MARALWTSVRLCLLVAPLTAAAVSSSSIAAAQTNLALGRPATASANPQYPANEAVDGNMATRWASAQGVDPQWIYVDLGTTTAISRVVLRWETAYGKAYQIQTSPDAVNWTSIFSTTTGAGGVDDLAVSGSGRYVRMYGTVRGTGYGYSLWEFEVYSSAGATATATTTATFTATATNRATPTATTRPTATTTSTATATATATASTTTGTNIALNKPATASSIENSGTTANLAVDGSTTTRWSSAASDPQWLSVDLGGTASITRVRLNWETAYGKAYQIQVSSDNTNWTTIASTTAGDGGLDDYTGLSASGRYVRMYGTARGTGYGYSLWEFEVYGTMTSTPTPTATSTTTPTATPTVTATATATPDGTVNLGPNVFVFDPSMSAASIQSQIDSVYATEHTNQFGTQRYALLFKPGTYNGLTVNVGFYTQVAGLGANPDDVLINGNIQVLADWLTDSAGNPGNATCNFWRAVENLATAPAPSDGTGWARWAVAQAAPFRRVHVKGSMFLWDGGWASGGYMADTLLDGWVEPGSQQQWYTRNSNLVHSWGGGVWNMVFQGVTNAPAETGYPNPPYTTIATTPVVREKPFLYVNAAGQYNVFVPALRTNTSGVSWPNAAGTSIPISNFLVVRNDNFSVTAINSALAAGQHILFTPGIYHLNDTIRITQPNTVVLGLGLATLSADTGLPAMTVADVDGVKIAHILFEAGAMLSPSLLSVGPAGSSASHAGNPTSLHDVFFRLGGAQVGQAQDALDINSADAIVDHTWIWRADHGNGVGWNTNVGVNGLVVNGNNATVYGLFSEHFEKHDVLWNGNNGRTYFFQNEMAYDVPNQASWMDGSSLGFAAYKVAPGVANHQAFGLGSYCLFLTDPSVHAAHAFETPTGAGIHFHHVLSLSLGSGTIDHVINNTGDAAVASSVVPHNVVDYP
jgi:hypothetical protein